MIKLTAIQYKEIIHSEERDYIEKQPLESWGSIRI